MPELGHDLRPVVDTFEVAGCQVRLVDGADILAVAAQRRVDLLSGVTFPAPVRRVRFQVTSGVRDGTPVHLFHARIRTGARGRRPAFAVLGQDPLGVWLGRRIAAGDPWAARLVDGVGTAANALSERLGVPPPKPPVDEEMVGPVRVREVHSGEVTATVAMGAAPGDGQLVTIEAAVPSATATPTHLREACVILLQVIDGLVDTTPGLAGQRIVVSRLATADTDDPESVTLDQVGGLNDVVAQFRQIAVSFQHPEVMARWGARRPQGVLMYGPPGTGKTMLAQALANEIGARLRQIRTPEILDKWLGASERNIKRIFQSARRVREPTVMLFDEFDSIISYTGAGMDAASQAVNAVAGIFKQEMNDLIEHNPNVIVVATTNFPDRVDESLTRSGRFDVKLAIPLPDESGRAQIWVKMLRQLIARHETPGFRMFADDVDPEQLARASRGMTGADLKEALRRVRLAKAMHEARTGTATPISQADLAHVLAELSGSGTGAGTGTGTASRLAS